MQNLKNAYVLDACIWPENGRFKGMTEDYKESLMDACFLTLDGTDFRTGVECLGEVSKLTDDPTEKIKIARTYDDLMRNKAEGYKSLILYFQDPAPLENKIHVAKAFYEMGVRVIQMSYNKGGYIGGGCVEGGDYGLTDFGKSLVKEFNNIGMLIDLSHCGPKVVSDVLELSEKPVTIGHTCCKAVADSPRNKTDEQLKRLKENGGVVGLTPWAPICWKRKENVPPTIEDYLDHVCHAVEIVGIDHVGFASDNNLDHASDIAGIQWQGALFDLITGVYNKNVGTDPKERHALGFTGVLDIQNLVDGMRRRGFNNEEIEKFLGGNFLRVIKEVWK